MAVLVVGGWAIGFMVCFYLGHRLSKSIAKKYSKRKEAV